VVLTARRPPRCSARHTTCSRYHWELVEAYRAARTHDELARDVACGGMPGTDEWAAATSGMVTFRDWLTSSREGSDRAAA